MKYSIGDKVDFLWDNYDYYYNTDIVYEGTDRLSGKIESYNEEKNSYGIIVGDTIYTVKEENIINKTAEFKKYLIVLKIKIANAALKMRDALYGCDHLAHHEECQ